MTLDELIEDLQAQFPNKELPSRSALGRKRKADEWNRLDAYTVEFHQRVRAGYLEMVEQEPGRWAVIDAGKAWDDVQNNLRKVILESLTVSEA